MSKKTQRKRSRSSHKRGSRSRKGGFNGSNIASNINKSISNLFSFVNKGITLAVNSIKP